MGDNGNSNGKDYEVGKGKPPKEHQFTSENQPSPEAKKKGWERRREAQKIMDVMLELTDMPYSEIKELLEDIKRNPDKHTLREVKLANYLMDKKYTVDYLDRHISKAPQEVDVKSGGKEINTYTFKIKRPEGDNGETD